MRKLNAHDLFKEDDIAKTFKKKLILFIYACSDN
jgi:hypothetical protein